MSVKERIMTIRLMEKLQAKPAYAKALRITADIQERQQNDTHSYHVTFQVESGDRMELKVIRSEYDMLLVGDRGRVSFQGTRYLGFERGLEEPDETVI